MTVRNSQNWNSISWPIMRIFLSFSKFFIVIFIIHALRNLNNDNLYQNNSNIIGFINKMKKQYSFKGSSRLNLEIQEQENRPSYASSKMGKNSWTDLRVEEIKKKYDTPSNRKTFKQGLSEQRSIDRERGSQGKSMLRDSLAHQVNTIETTHFQNSSKPPKQTLRQRPNERNTPFKLQENENKMIQKFSQIKSCLKSEYTKNVNGEFSKYRDYPKDQIDPRVENINKINTKIKKILQCLHQNEISQKKQFSTSFLKQSVISRGNTSDKSALEETKIISRQIVAGHDHLPRKIVSHDYVPRQQTQFPNKLCFSPKKNGEESKIEDNKFVIKSSSSFYQQKNKQEYSSPYNKLEKNIGAHQQSYENAKFSHNRNRARSCLNGFKNQTIDVSNKKVDEEIDKTTQRIKALEQAKRKLNIDFKPYKYELRVHRSTSNLTKNTSHSVVARLKTSQFMSSFEQKAKPQIKLESKQKSTFYDYSNVQVPLSSQNSQKSAEFAKVNENQEQQEKQQTFQIEESNNNKLKQQTDQGIQKRKRKLLETATVTFSRQTKRFIQNLFQQVKLDEEFRNGKIWFRDLCEMSKIDTIDKLLRKRGKQMQKQVVGKILKVSEEEDNPFFSNRQSQMSYEQLVEIWIRCENHWNEYIANKFDLQQFEVQKFTCDKIDLQKKGYFTVEDLVRFINMQTGTFYRKRDLILIFRRLTPGSKLQWNEFIQTLQYH